MFHLIDGPAARKQDRASCSVQIELHDRVPCNEISQCNAFRIDIKYMISNTYYNNLLM